jgi:hypothetical protein
VLDSIEIKKPRIPVVSNVDARPHSDPAVIKELLKKQVGLRTLCPRHAVPHYISARRSSSSQERAYS